MNILEEEYNKRKGSALEYVKELAHITMSDETTVRKWVKGITTPPLIKLKLISEHYHLPFDKVVESFKQQ